MKRPGIKQVDTSVVKTTEQGSRTHLLPHRFAFAVAFRNDIQLVGVLGLGFRIQGFGFRD